jgi:outer membrane protein assembly factor BamA
MMILRTDSSASEILKKQSGEFSELAGIMVFKYDKRNRSFMPTSGSIFLLIKALPIYADKAI